MAVSFKRQPFCYVDISIIQTVVYSLIDIANSIVVVIIFNFESHSDHHVGKASVSEAFVFFGRAENRVGSYR